MQYFHRGSANIVMKISELFEIGHGYSLTKVSHFTSKLTTILLKIKGKPISEKSKKHNFDFEDPYFLNHWV